MIFNYCNCVSTGWQWSVDSYKDGKETAVYKRKYSTQNNTKHRIHERENNHTKQEIKHNKSIKRRKLSK